MRIFARCLLLVAVLLQLIAASAYARAGDAADGDFNYSVHRWQQEQGLPQNTVNTVLQGQDGYLWLATYGGLARFDGERFVTFDGGNTPAFKQCGGIVTLTESRKGELWITDDAGNIVRMTGRSFEFVEAFPGRSFDHIAVDDAGDVWMIDLNRNLLRLADKREFRFDPSKMKVWTLSQLIVEENTGWIWVLRHGTLEYLSGGELHAAKTGADAPVICIGPGKQGDLWVVFENKLERWASGRKIEELPLPRPLTMNISGIRELPDGNLAIGTSENGLFLFGRNGRSRHFDEVSGLGDNWVKNLTVDREGTLWAGLGNGGVCALQKTTFETVASLGDWEQRPPTSVFLGSDGTLWVGTEGAGLYQYDGKGWSRTDIHAMAENRYVWSIAEDKEGRLWVGTWGGGVCVRENGVFHIVADVARPNETAPIFQMARDGGLWIGGAEGLFRERPDGVIRRIDAPWLHTTIRAMKEDTDGSLWVGTYGQGVGHLVDGRWKFFGAAEGIPDEHVQALHLDGEGGVWIGTLAVGLQRIKNGKIRTVDPAKGLSLTNVHDILDDGHGYFWLCTRNGIARVSKQSLNALADGGNAPLDYPVFSTWDGLPSVECSGSGLVAPDGKLWYSTRRGLVRTDPETVRINKVPPLVMLEECTADGEEIPAIEPDARRVVPPGRSRFVFKFSASTFIAPENAHFQYQLVGLDRKWIDGGAGRTAIYSFIPPGVYRFRVRAANSHGVWNEKPAEIGFTIRPFFWQTWWFRLSAYGCTVAILVLSAIALNRRRWKRRLEKLERRQAVERERSRISKDIHDELGASLTRIALLAQTARKELATSPDEATAQMDRIYRAARESTRTMDEIVWAVNPNRDTLDSIATYIAAFSQDFLSSAGIACRWHFPLDLSPWPVPAEKRHNLFLACKEALNNVVKHAKATQVTITITVSPEEFVLVVADNGVGLTGDPRPEGTGGNGLSSMRHRMEEMGGRCEITSEPGQGTQVKFAVPAETSGAKPHDI
jgi:signal transduction histidine kinase/ligand-binding sensor domain-containing protein